MHLWCYNSAVRSDSLLTYMMGNTHPIEFVLIVMWVHLFPSRTQKLSTRTPTIVAGRLAVKIGNANTMLFLGNSIMPVTVHRTVTTA